MIMALAMMFSSLAVVQAVYLGDVPGEMIFEEVYETGYAYEIAYAHMEQAFLMYDGHSLNEVLEIEKFEAEAFTMAASAASNVWFEGGDGIGTAFRIATPEQLLLLSHLTAGIIPNDDDAIAFFNRARYMLVDDIDMYGIFNFRPIGYQQTNAFTGTFEGNNHTISNLYLHYDVRITTRAFVPTIPEINSVGMFGITHNANIRRFTLENPRVVVMGHERDNISFLAGTAANSTIYDILVTGGTIHAPRANNVGGIAGSSIGSSIENVTVKNSEVRGANSTGGIVGYISGGTVRNATFGCVVSGNTASEAGAFNHVSYPNTVTGYDNVGGVVGRISGIRNGVVNASQISNSGTASNTNVTGNDNTGGVFGFATDTVSTFDNFSRANITGRDNVGGIGGNIQVVTADLSLTNSYSVGNIRGNDNVGGILGQISGTWWPIFTISDNYSHSNIRANAFVGGIVGNTIGSTLTITRNYVNSAINTSGNHVGGIVGNANASTTVSNNFIIAKINRPSSAGNVSIVGNGLLAARTTSNYYSFASTIDGDAIEDCIYATRVHQQSITVPIWWSNTLQIGSAFNLTLLWEGFLPTVRMRNSMVEVREQDSEVTFAGNHAPELLEDEVIYVLGTNQNLRVSFDVFGGNAVRNVLQGTQGLRNPQDYIPDGDAIIFRREYLESLSVGRRTYRVNFLSGHTVLLRIEIKEETPEAPRLRIIADGRIITDDYTIIDFDSRRFGNTPETGFKIGIFKDDISRDVVVRTRLTHTDSDDGAINLNFQSILLPVAYSAGYHVISIPRRELINIVDGELNMTKPLIFTFYGGAERVIFFREI